MLFPILLVVSFLLVCAVVSRATTTKVPSAPPPPPGDLSEVRAHIAAGRTIDAIKSYREATGCGLKDAKDAVDKLAGKL